MKGLLKRLFEPVAVVMAAVLIVTGLGLLKDWVEPAKADSWRQGPPTLVQYALSAKTSAHANENFYDMHFSKHQVWKVIKRDRWSFVYQVETANELVEVERVSYIIQNSDGKRLELRPCIGLQDKFVEGEKIKIEKGTFVGGDIGCSLYIYKE